VNAQIINIIESKNTEQKFDEHSVFNTFFISMIIVEDRLPFTLTEKKAIAESEM
jgi:NADH:ubiquinone oxidoreductase subunit H